MKIKIEKNSFLQTLQKTQGVVEKRTTMPILSNILMEAKQGGLEIIATDLEVSFKDVCSAQVIKEGGTTINARKLFEIVKELPENTIEIEVKENNRTTIKSGKARYNINGLPVSEFPAFPSYNEGIMTVVNPEAVKDMIEKTVFAISLDETRHNINGLFFETENNKIRMVATDGYRLALAEKEVDTEIGLKKGVIIPKKGVLELKRLLETEGSLLMGFTENSGIFKKGDAVLVTRLIDGEFPEYKQVIPKGNDKTITIEKEKLASSLRRMSVLSTDKIKGVKINISKGKMELYSSNPDLGDAMEEMDIDYKGDNIEMSFNANYIIDALNILTTKDIVIELKDSVSPCVIKTIGSADYIYVVMPMRI